LDSKDDRKVQLVQASESFGQKRLRTLLFIESIVALLVVSLFSLIQGKPILLLMWAAGICLGYVYSAPPLRLKSRSWLAPISLILVLAVFPVLFAYYTLSSQVDSLFLLSLTGLALTVYGVIVPTEIRDYFGDRAMGIETLTVRLGLVKASLLAILLLSIGATLTGAALFLEWFRGPRPMLSLLLLAIPVAVITVLLKLRMLYSLSKEHESSDDQSAIAEEIVNLSAHNPQWIMMVTQTYSILSIILLANKFVA
jgi:4-hydroxybenzoate polyprenyltransferase